MTPCNHRSPADTRSSGSAVQNAGRIAAMVESSSLPDSARPRPLPTSASYAITVRLFADPDPAVVGVIATAVGAAGGVVTAIDVTESRHDRLTIDVTCSAANGEHAQEIVAALSAIDGVEVYRVSDRTFLLHLGGKIAVTPKVALKTRDDLSKIGR